MNNILPSNQNPIKGVPPVARSNGSAHVIRDDLEAIDIATQLAQRFVRGAIERDAKRTWPLDEVERYSRSGLWSLNVPRAFGGPELSYVTVSRTIEIIAAADPSLAQIPQNHIGLVAAIRTVSKPAQQKLLFENVLSGIRFGNAFSEFGSKRAADFETRFRDAGDHVIVNGRKFYATGALLAHLVPIVALDDENRPWYVIAERSAKGLTVIDDWSSFGQRTTLSGTVVLEDVKVPKTHLVPGYKGYDHPTADGAVFQIIQAAIDTGIARAAIEDTIAFIRTKARPWVDSGKDQAVDDPYAIQAIGDLELRLTATQALLEKAGQAVDVAVENPNAETVANAQISVAKFKVFSTELAIAATNKLFELGGTRSTLAEHALDRHWRNARTHTLHDPVRWKYAIIGNFYLNGVNPPFHAWI